MKGYFAVGLLGLALTASAASAAVTVKPLRISETRWKELATRPVREGEPVFGGFGQELNLTLWLDGPELKGATQWGKLKITTAEDDAGTDLVKKEEGAFGNDEFRDFDRGFSMGNSQGGDKPDKPRDLLIDLRLGLPARKATQIKTIKGELEVLAGGQRKTVTVKNPNTLIGKKIDNPDLKKAGVEVQVIDPKTAGMGGEEGNQVAVTLTGAINTVESIDVVDEKGQSLGQGQGSSTMNDVQTRYVQLEKPADAKATLKINLNVGQKPVKVPLELKNIPLP